MSKAKGKREPQSQHFLKATIPHEDEGGGALDRLFRDDGSKRGMINTRMSTVFSSFT